MADIFVSYAREDHAKTKALSTEIENEGYSVWWDRSLYAGQDFRGIIQQELRETKCVVVLWSRSSVASPWVLSEAQSGMDRNILIPAVLEKVEVPIPFNTLHSADLASWPETGGDSIKSLLYGIGGLLKPEHAVSAKDGRSLRPSKKASHASTPASPLAKVYVAHDFADHRWGKRMAKQLEESGMQVVGSTAGDAGAPDAMRKANLFVVLVRETMSHVTTSQLRFASSAIKGRGDDRSSILVFGPKESETILKEGYGTWDPASQSPSTPRFLVTTPGSVTEAMVDLVRAMAVMNRQRG